MLLNTSEGTALGVKSFNWRAILGRRAVARLLMVKIGSQVGLVPHSVGDRF